MPVLNTYIQHNIRHSSRAILLEKVSTWKERSKFMSVYRGHDFMYRKSLQSVHTYTYTKPSQKFAWYKINIQISLQDTQ